MSSPDVSTISHLLQNGPYKSEDSQKQITIAFGGQYIASTTPASKALLVYETQGGSPVCYIPVASLHNDVRSSIGGQGPNVETIETVVGPDGQPGALIEMVTFGSKTAPWVRFVEGPLKGFVRFEPSDIDDWFENGGLFTPGENPNKRQKHGMFHRKAIDTKPVNNHIVVKIDGEVVAETNSAVLLKQHGLKPAYYLPATSIKNWGSLERSNLRTTCPYKGEASYFNITVNGKKYNGMIWYYPHPTSESEPVEGFISFYQKPNVEILVDGKRD